MFSQWSTQHNSTHSRVRLEVRRKRAAYSLSRRSCIPPLCAETQTSLKETAIGGAVRPLPEPHPSRPVKWKSVISLPLPNHSSVSASAYQDDSGDGIFTWQRRTSRTLRKQSQVKPNRGNMTAARTKKPDLEFLHNLGLVAGRDSNFSLQNCLQGLKLTDPMKPISVMFQKRKSNTTAQLDRRTRFQLRRMSNQDAVTFSLDDSVHGHAKLSILPRKRLTASFRLIRSTAGKRLSSAEKIHAKPGRPKNSSGVRLPCIRSDIEYDWKRNSYVLLHRVETSRRSAQLRIATNPLRITPRIEIPLGRKASSSPSLTWTREPMTGFGGFEFGWKGMQISTDWTHPSFSIRRRTSDGGYSVISLNNRRTLKLDQNLVSKPIRGGVVLSLTSCMTNQKDMTGASVTANGPWGSISAHARTSMACGFSVTSDLHRKKRSFRFRLVMENLKTASFRIGIFY